MKETKRQKLVPTHVQQTKFQTILIVIFMLTLKENVWLTTKFNNKSLLVTIITNLDINLQNKNY